MIVFLDANALMQDPMCSGVVWHVLVHAPDTWGLRLATSEVAVAEALGGYGRRVADEMSKVGKLAHSWGALGATDEAGLILSRLESMRDSYRDHLESSLSAANVEVLAVPDVPHMDLVSRSVARRRPCDDRGDGYRDTLVWLSVMRAARANPDQEVIFVTKDSDFLDDDRQGFHPDLVEDLIELGADSRVRVCTVLSDVLLELADESSDDATLRSLQSDLEDETVRLYVQTLTSELANLDLDPQACALPRKTSTSLLQEVGPIEHFKYSIKGGLPRDEAVAEFSFEASTRVVITLPAGVSPDAYEAALPVQAEGTVLYVIAKALVYSGIVRLGRYARPLGGQITRIAARPDDPGRREWRMDRARAGLALASLVSNMEVNLVADAMRKTNVSLVADAMEKNANLVAHAMKNMNVNPFAQIMENMDVNTELADGSTVKSSTDGPADTEADHGEGDTDPLDTT